MKKRARNIWLKVSYDGAGYHGFQRQRPPVVAVQNTLESALEKVFGDKIELAAAGRTDAGVHALGQVVNFFTDGKIPVEKIPFAVNNALPPDITVLAAGEAPRDFSARHSARHKTYIYCLTENKANPFLAKYAWQVGKPLELAAINEAMSYLIGTHDFSAFRAKTQNDVGKSSVRHLTRAAVERNQPTGLDFWQYLPQREKDAVIFTFSANGFLYHMVRNIVATLVAVGLGEKTPAEFAIVMAAGDRAKASPTAPAAGLYLLDVQYDIPLK